MKAFLSMTIGIVLALGGVEAPAEDLSLKEIPLAIEPGTLADALAQWAAQTKLQVISTVDETAVLKAPKVHGTFTPRAALDQLLAGTPLVSSWINERTVAIRKRATTVSAATGKDAVPLAAVAQESEPRQTSTSATGPRAELSADTGIPEILVKGNRTANTDIRRSEDGVQPYVVFDGEDIRKSGALNINDFLKSRLPQNASGVTPSQGSITGGGRSEINLRGLSANQTVVLVDGRRLASSSSFGSNGAQPDINGISVASIERIEILPATASGIYGGGATGGVVNIITRKDFNGAEIGFMYGNTADSDAEQKRLDIVAGANAFGGRTRVSFTGSYAEAGMLRGADRDFAERSLELQFANNPAAFHALGAAPPAGYTGNIVSQNGSNLVLDNNTPLNSPRTFIPIGYAGPASDNGAALVPHAGRFNFEMPDSGLNPLLMGSEIGSLSLGLRQDIAAPVEAFADLLWSNNKAIGETGTLTTVANLAANAAHNPFTTPIRVSVPISGLSIPSSAETETVRGAGGLIVRLPRSWTLSADYSWSRSRFDVALALLVFGDPDGAGPNPPFTTALSNGTLNPMRDLNANPIDYGSYLLPFPNFIDGPVETILKSPSLRVGGPLVELPAGPMAISALLERRDEELKPALRSSMLPTAAITTQLAPGGSQETTSYYVELNTPLISERNPQRFARALSLQASIRRDEYELTAGEPSQVTLPTPTSPAPPFTFADSGSQATSFTFGALYSPVDDLKVRASFGTGFLPPSLGNIVRRPPTNNVTSLQPFIDPKRGNTLTSGGSYTTLSGGNPALEPEESKSYAFGVVLTPRFAPGLRLSADYIRIEKTEEIFNTLTADILLALEDSLPGRVFRNPLNTGDATLGYTGGTINGFDFTAANLSSARIDAIDMQVDYEWRIERLGDFHAYAVLTRQLKLDRKVTPNAESIDGVGYFEGTTFTALKMRGNLGLTWTRGPWSADWNMQYYDSYRPWFPGSSQATIDALVLNQGSNRIPSQDYHDITVRYAFANGLAVLDGAEVRLTVENIFDTTPPILARVSHASTGYSTFGDPRLRRYAISFRKAF